MKCQFHFCLPLPRLSLRSLSSFQTHKSDFFIPYKSGAASEVVEVEFPWQTSTKHQHRIYKYILISIHCKISPTQCQGHESRWSPLRVSTSWIRSLECQVSHLITSYICSSNLSRFHQELASPPGYTALPLLLLFWADPSRMCFIFCTKRVFPGLTSPFLAP